MAVYAIGDIQGCFSALMRLLDRVQFDQSADTLWFCGDLVNRGPESLKTLQYVRSLGSNAITVLGNHDLHLLALYSDQKQLPAKDSLYQVLSSPDCDELLAWLSCRPLVHYDSNLDFMLAHAGIHPDWSVAQALSYAHEVEQVLQGDSAQHYFTHMYGDLPSVWSTKLTGVERLRCITNIFTRMRYFDASSNFDFQTKDGPKLAHNKHLTPWFDIATPEREKTRTVFGHWSTLPTGVYGQHYALDHGCVWGGKLTALQIDLAEPCWFHVDC